MTERPYIVVKLDDELCMPNRAHLTDAGADLVSKGNVSIYPGETMLLDTGVAVKIPEGYVGLVYNRSSQGKIGIAIPHSVGVIDSDYRGNIKVLLVNNGNVPYKIEQFKTKIAQLVIAPIELVEFKPWNPAEESWEDTQRGTGGFGSTDKGNT